LKNFCIVNIRALSLIVVSQFCYFSCKATPHAHLNEMNPHSSASCAENLLGRFGWTQSDRSNVNWNAYDLCRYRSLEEAKRSGQLTYKALHEPESGQNLVDSPASYCSFRLALADATRAAAKKISDNKKFSFQPIKSDPRNQDPEAIVGTTALNYWEIESAKLSMYVKDQVKPSEALNQFYNPAENTYVDCYAGALTVSTLGHLELLGASRFDQMFKPSEIFIGILFTTLDQIDGRGNPLDVTRSYSGLDGKEETIAGWTTDSSGRISQSRGRADFIGRRGSMASLLHSRFLDSIVDVNENFVITDFSEAAQTKMDELTKKGQNIADYIRAISVGNWLQKLDAAVASNNGNTSALLEAKETFFKENPYYRDFKNQTPFWSKQLEIDPIVNGITVYVHPLGERTLKYHINRLIEFNPRMPYEFRLRDTNLETTIYSKYKQFFTGQCTLSGGAK
jgi:hypothetical protein